MSRPNDVSNPILHARGGIASVVTRARIDVVALETARLMLRPLTLADAPAMVTLANDPAVSDMTARLPYPYRDTDAASFITRQVGQREAGNELVLAMTRLADGAFLGAISLRITGPASAELGYWLGQAHWNEGYGTEAARAMVDHGFNRIGLQRLTAECRVINAASRQVLEKCGLHYTGSGLSPAPARGGAVPVDRFELSRRHWSSLKNWRPALTYDMAEPQLGNAL